MQYLLKISLQNTSMWRLIAVDGLADRAHMGQLIAYSFDYPKGNNSFEIAGKSYTAGTEGKANNSEELIAFDDFKLQADDIFTYKHESDNVLTHEVKVMKCEDHLFCLMPSCLVGSGPIPKDTVLSEEGIAQYLDGDETPSLDLREVTNRLRAYGSSRKDVSQAMVDAGAAPLNFNVK